MDDLHLILKTAAKFVSLEVNGYCSVYRSSVKEYNCHHPLRLKSLNLVRVPITSYDLLGLLEWCKDTIIKFFFNEWDISRARELKMAFVCGARSGNFDATTS